MDPNGIAREEWLDDVPVPGQADTGKGKTYARRVTYNDGRVVMTYYRYGTNQEVATRDLPADEDQQRRFEAEQKSAQQPPQERPNYTTGFYERWDPQTRTWVQTDRPVSAGEKPAQQGQSRLEERNGKTYIVQPDGTVVETALPANQPKPEFVQAADGKTYQIAVGPDGTATATPVQGLPGDQPKPEFVQGADGRTYQVSVGPDGKATATPVEGLPGKPEEPNTVVYNGRPHQVINQNGTLTLRPIPVEGETPPPAVGQAELQAGRIYQGLRDRKQKLDELVEAGTLSQQQADTIFENDYKMAEALLQDMQLAVQAEGAVYAGDVNQRGQDTTRINQRMASGGSMFDAATRVASEYAGLVHGGRLLEDILQRGEGFLQRIGALDNPARVQYGPTTTALAGVGSQGNEAMAGGGRGTAFGPGAPAQPGAQPPQTRAERIAAGVLPQVEVPQPGQQAQPGAGQPAEPKGSPAAVQQLTTLDLPGGIKIRIPTAVPQGTPQNPNIPLVPPGMGTPSPTDPTGGFGPQPAAPGQGVPAFLQQQPSLPSFDWESVLGGLGFDDGVLAAARASRLASGAFF